MTYPVFQTYPERHVIDGSLCAPEIALNNSDDCVDISNHSTNADPIACSDFNSDVTASENGESDSYHTLSDSDSTYTLSDSDSTYTLSDSHSDYILSDSDSDHSLRDSDVHSISDSDFNLENDLDDCVASRSEVSDTDDVYDIFWSRQPTKNEIEK
ncbi:hypothetical protein GHT06_009086 [Daphnia sinensis]|uniref:Uncharacterized protein n=1 Tax=Daphnia sinensis TaxID=1820382 RepID=A0AAD5LN29_9CRUS|nr:hypothetical protein GHT06_009086 [Daphnia sinensis]